MPCASTSAAPKNAPATTTTAFKTRTIFPQVQFGFQITKLRVELVTSDWVTARPLWVSEETEEIEGRSVETSAPVERWELHVIYDRPAVILTCMCICMCESYFCVVRCTCRIAYSACTSRGVLENHVHSAHQSEPSTNNPSSHPGLGSSSKLELSTRKLKSLSIRNKTD